MQPRVPKQVEEKRKECVISILTDGAQTRLSRTHSLQQQTASTTLHPKLQALVWQLDLWYVLQTALSEGSSSIEGPQTFDPQPYMNC